MLRSAASILLAAAAAFCQSAGTQPKFEVASVKPSPPRTPMMVGARGGPETNDPERFVCENFDLDALVQMAYGIARYQLSAPEWTYEARFDVEAKVPKGATKAEFRAMMQDLLQDRFRMAAHQEKRELTGYELALYKSGPKLKKSTEPFPKDPGIGTGDRLGVDGDGFPILPPGRFPWWTTGPNGHTRRRVANMSMADFATNLSMQLQGPVNNSTGLDGEYDFTLSWVFENRRGEVDGPDLFRALQDQLGLRLERRKEMVDVVVVDRMERVPTEN